MSVYGRDGSEAMPAAQGMRVRMVLRHRGRASVTTGCLVLVAVLVGAGVPAARAAEPWLDTARSPRERATALVAAMTVDEKIDQLHGVGSQQHFRYVNPVARLHVPPLVVANGPAGAGPNDSGGLT